MLLANLKIVVQQQNSTFSCIFIMVYLREEINTYFINKILIYSLNALFVFICIS